MYTRATKCALRLAYALQKRRKGCMTLCVCVCILITFFTKIYPQAGVCLLGLTCFQANGCHFIASIFSPLVVVLCRYLAFCLVWITQMKDAFWMEKSQYTMYVVVPFTLLPVAKLILFGNRFFFNGHETARGLLALTVAFVFFYLGLDDEHDPYRVFHGCAQLAAGAALYFMWQMIPENNYKKTDAYLPHNMQLTLT
eukprot:m.330428 g.330428  ORF g.330428 m.330428 type:complete len:197 (-) comp16045_c1_seq1:64-654(-)